MKVHPLFVSALLISTSSVHADDFIYLKCDYNMTNSLIDLKTNRLTEESKTGTLGYKVDTANSRMQASTSPQWDEVSIVDGVVIGQIKEDSPGFNMTMKYSVDITPPGNISIESLAFTGEQQSISVKVKGICQKSDRAFFNEASTFGDD